MTNKISNYLKTSACHELPSGSATTTETTTKRQPSLEEVYLDDERSKSHMHNGVSFSMFFMFAASATQIWQDLRRWQDLVIAAVVFLYFAVMMNLLLIKRHNDKKRELEASEWIIRTPERTPTLMLVVTGVMVVSLGVMLFFFRPRWLELAYIALCISVSMAMVFLFLKIAEIQQKKMLTEKHQDIPELV